MAAILAVTIVPGTTATPAPDPLDIALDHVGANAESLGVAAADVTDLFVMSQYTSDHNGVTHVNLNQRHQGLEVFGGHVTVNVATDGRVVFAAGTLAELTTIAAAGAADLDAIDAVEAAADALELDEPADLEIIESSENEVVVSDGGISDAPIPARLGWQPTAEGLRLAWQLTIDDSSDVHLFNATIDAATGELLEVDDWTSHDTLETLEATLKRSGGKRTASTHLPAAYPVPPTPLDDGSSYRVFRLPNESPNDGERQLVASPADGLASPYGWHDTDGVAGPEFTITRGNNVHAYLDQDGNNAPDFGDTEGGATLTFDFPVDLNEHSQAYRDAVVTNLFYGCNVFHDLTYRYGWNEVAGNFQANNYGRGGGQGDYVRCEAADGGGTNNANFSTPAADSGTPRMQMYLWPGNQLGSQNQVVVGDTSYGAGWARFGPPAPVAGITGELFDAGNGCVAADYAGAPAGPWVAIVVGGTTGCQPIQKARAADAAGAVAIIQSTGTSSTGIIASNSGGMNTASPAIPAVLVTTANGAAIRASMPASATVRKHPDHPGIVDGDFDVGIIYHEYGHGLSLRLTGGPGINCLSGNEQAGEGWSDYVAIAFQIDPDIDDPESTRGLVPYVLFQPDRTGNGLRPRPYSRNMETQPFTYDSIKTGGWLLNNAGNPTSLALPHGLGHGWAAVLWDVTWDLIDKHGFNPQVYQPWHTGGNNRAIQYVIDGLKFQGCGPGLLVARDAIIAAAEALPGNAGEDFCMLWASFARRGLGYSAVQGTTNRDDNTEAFDTHPACLHGFRPPVNQPYLSLNPWTAGDVLPLKFNAPGFTTANVLHTNSPFSRRVDCSNYMTFQVPSIGAGVTPREYPTATIGSLLPPVSPYHYNWVTDPTWAGTCREIVLTRTDGKQHRAYFEFLP